MAFVLEPATKINSVLDEITFPRLLTAIADRLNYVDPAYTPGLTLDTKLNSLHDIHTIDSVAAYVALYQANVPPSTPYGTITPAEKVNTQKDVVTISDVARYLLTGMRKERATPHITLNTTQVIGQWTVASGGTQLIATYPVPAPSGRTSGLKFLKTPAGTFGGTRTSTIAIPSFKLSNYTHVGMWVYWDAAQGSVSLRFASLADYTKRREFSWAWSGQLHKGWNLLIVRTTDDTATSPNNAAWTVTGGMAIDETVVGIQISVSANASNVADIYVDEVFAYQGAPAKGTLCFGFDAYGEASIPSIALPMYKAAGIKGYWAGDANLINGATNARAYLKQVYAEGWDVPTQGMLHPDYTVAGAAQLGQDIDSARAIMNAGGFKRSQDLFAYPLSANNDVTDAMLVSKGIRMARSGWSWRIHRNEFNAGPKLIGHGAVNLGGKTRAQMLSLVDEAVYYGSAIFPFTHGVLVGGDGITPPANTNYVYDSDLQAMVNYYLTKRNLNQCEALSMSEYLRAYHY